MTDKYDALNATSQEFWLSQPITEKALLKLSFAVNLWADSKGFNTVNQSFGEIIALMHSELSEALEADRKDLRDSHLPQFNGVEVELADLLIRVFHYCGRQQINIGHILCMKMAYNCNRPHKHGKKY